MKKCKKILLSMLSLMLVLSSFVPLSIEQAHAQEQTITGKCTIRMIKSSLDGHPATTFAVTMPDGVVKTGYCLNHGKPTPADGEYSFTGTLNSSGTYDIVVNSRFLTSDISRIHPRDRGVLNTPPPYTTQAVGGFTWNPVREGKAKLKKTTASNKHLTDLCPENYSIAGAVYGVYTNSDLTGKVGEFVTDETGNSNELKLKKGIYHVKELTAPKGYMLNPEIYTLVVTENETTVLNVADEPTFDPFNIKIIKKTSQNVDKNLSLAGAEYTVKYYKEGKDEINIDTVANFTPFRTWIISTKEKNNNGEIVGEAWLLDAYKVGGDEFFKNDEGDEVGLLGTITVEETKAPKGFAKTEGIISLQHITQDGATNEVSLLKDVMDNEKPQTISLTIEKKDSETGTNQPQGHGTLEGAKYEVSFWNVLENVFEKVATLVTNAEGKAVYENGKPGLYKVEEIEASRGYIVDTAIKEIKAGIKELNTANFNYDVESLEDVTKVEFSKTTIDENGNTIHLAGATIQLLDDTGAVIEEFVTTNDPKVIKGLTVGKTYTFREVKTPVGYFKAEDVSVSIKETKEPQKVEMFDEPVPEIKTTALFENGKKMTPASKMVKTVDRVSYKKLIVGKEYVAKAKLVRADDENIVVATGEKTFVPTESNGYVDVELMYDASELEGKTVVVFEDLYKNGVKLVSHNDITDIEQSVHFPKIRTTALDKKDNDKHIFAEEKATIIDTVKYENLIAGKEYTISGKLMNKVTGKPLLDKDGNEITASKTFVATEKNGTETLEFTFDARLLKGSKIVVFEDVLEDGIVVGTHSDINDEEQSVYVPEIKTTAKFSDEAKEKTLAAKMTLVDTVKYANLIAGKEYTISGKLMNKETGQVYVDADGKEVTATKTFVAEAEDGTVELEFTFNGMNLQKTTKLVVFEKLFEDEEGLKLIAEHEDIYDEGQTVTVKEPGRIIIEEPKDKHRAKTADDTMLGLMILGLLASAGSITALTKRK